MKHKQLFVLLTAQAQNLDELLKAAQLQQNSLVNNNRDKLDESVRKEEGLFALITQYQARVTEEIKCINEEEKLNLKDYKLSSLLAAYTERNEPELKQFAAFKKHFVETIKEINKFNFQNSFLIDHSRTLIRQIILESAKSKNAIFDRRV